MIKLIYPDKQKLRETGVVPVSTVSLRWTDKHPQSSYGCGVLLYGKTGDIFDGVSYRAARALFGAVLVYNGLSRKKICGALGVTQSDDGIIEAYTIDQIAKLREVSRQYIYQLIQRDKIASIKFGDSFFVLPQAK